MNSKTAHLNPAPQSGHFRMLDASNAPLDSMAGPRDFMVRMYLANGFRVIDEKGREIVGA